MFWAESSECRCSKNGLGDPASDGDTQRILFIQVEVQKMSLNRDSSLGTTYAPWLLKLEVYWKTIACIYWQISGCMYVSLLVQAAITNTTVWAAWINSILLSQVWRLEVRGPSASLVGCWETDDHLLVLSSHEEWMKNRIFLLCLMHPASHVSSLMNGAPWPHRLSGAIASGMLTQRVHTGIWAEAQTFSP